MLYNLLMNERCIYSFRSILFYISCQNEYIYSYIFFIINETIFTFSTIQKYQMKLVLYVTFNQFLRKPFSFDFYEFKKEYKDAKIQELRLKKSKRYKYPVQCSNIYKSAKSVLRTQTPIIIYAEPKKSNLATTRKSCCTLLATSYPFTKPLLITDSKSLLLMEGREGDRPDRIFVRSRSSFRAWLTVSSIKRRFVTLLQGSNEQRKPS